jgi:hypothetical protein
MIVAYKNGSSQAAYGSFNWGQKRTGKWNEENGTAYAPWKERQNLSFDIMVGKSSTGTNVIWQIILQLKQSNIFWKDEK